MSPTKSLCMQGIVACMLLKAVTPALSLTLALSLIPTLIVALAQTLTPTLNLIPNLANTRRLSMQESWYEKLNRWDEALDAYERKYGATASNPRAPAHIDAALGRLRCLAALAEWNKLSNVARDEWRRVDPHVQARLMRGQAHLTL